MGIGNFAQRVVDTLWGTGQHASGGHAGLPTGDSVVFNSAIAKDIVEGLSAGDLYETQPHLRTVVSFVARNAAQLGRHVYKTGTDDSRERVKTSALQAVLEKPNDYQSGFDLFDMLFSELALYDFALWIPKLTPTGWQIDPIPGAWITGVTRATAFKQEKYHILPTDATSGFTVLASDAVVFRGYSPKGFVSGSSAVVSLKGTLSEQVSAMDFRRQMWKRGGRVGMFMTRPKDAAEWSPEAKAKFVQSWKNSWAGDGANAGSTPLLEDGMELKRIGFNAKEEQWLEAATLSLSTVAGAYHVPPAMVGVAGYNSFASVKEFRKMLYTETLGPLVAQVEETINTFLTVLIGEPKGNFLELNIGEKLQGDFEEQGNVLFQAVGGPYMTPNEARKKVNMPAIEGGDELLTPLNMGATGNNGPAADEPIDQAPVLGSEPVDPDEDEPKANGLRDGDRARGRKAPDTHALHEDLATFFAAQRKSILASLGSKSDAWWDGKKWNAELSAVMRPHLTTISAGTAHDVASSKKLDPAAYSVARTENFIKAVSDSRADLVNATTRDHYKNAIENDTDPELVYEDSESRGKSVAGTLTTFISAWATIEVAKQLVPDKQPTKTWIASGLPNSRHADMDGETVGIDEDFSNGAKMPGDPVLGAEEVANCGCGVEIDY